MIWETIREGGSNEGAEGRAKDGIPGLAKGEAGRGRSRRREQGEERSCLESAACILILLIFTGILLLLLYLSITGSAAVYGGAEQVWFYKDSPLYHLLVFMLVTALGVMILKVRNAEGREEKSREEQEERRKRFVRLLLILSGFYVIWIMGTMFRPASDQRLVIDCGKALAAGDLLPWNQVGFRYHYDEFEGYAYTYPHQNGQILFAAFLSLLAGEQAAFLWQLLNVACLAAGILYTGKMAEEVLEMKNGFYGLALLMMAFLPFSFYVTFAYGTLPGFACSAAAVWYERRFLEERRKRDLILSSVLISAAILFKSNYMIVLTAMVLFFIAEAVFRKKLFPLLGAAAVLSAYLLSHSLVLGGLSLAAGHSVEGGPPMLTWVEMGLQEGSRAPGWFNNYNVHIYLDNREDRELTAAAVERDLGRTIQYFMEHPDYAADFFNRKLRSIWTEPTFQSLWIQEVKGFGWLFPSFTRSLFKEGGTANEIYWQLCNAVQTLVYAGALLFAVFRFRRVKFQGLFFAVIFIGGFLFHLFWEAKGQYTVSYFTLLIPYAVLGMQDWIHWVSKGRFV